MFYLFIYFFFFQIEEIHLGQLPSQEWNGMDRQQQKKNIETSLTAIAIQKRSDPAPIKSVACFAHWAPQMSACICGALILPINEFGPV